MDPPPLTDTVSTLSTNPLQEKCAFQALFTADAVRFHVVCLWNTGAGGCRENALLALVAAAHPDVAGRDGEAAAADAATAAGWALVADARPVWSARAAAAAAGDPVPVRLYTANGVLVSTSHPLPTPAAGRRGPIPNTFPGVPVYARPRVARVEALSACHVYRVSVAPAAAAAAAVPPRACVEKRMARSARAFRREVGHLAAAPPHPNLVGLVGLVVDAAGLVEGALLEWIDGPTLADVRAATAADKAKWRSQVRAAVTHLHAAGLTWGDAKTGNVVVRRASRDAVLIDLDGGYTEKWVTKALAGTPRGDWMGVERICHAIDALPTLDDAAPAQSAGDGA
ncbi:hypothetical protein BU14_0532s0016 [Porphyra umbilicalis]|uniref:Protein kinase domain-containing protein n=1 Tax=Porphyra umbilicalis TaxID=2786 RepID=A0A1X6NSA2_PORUM|nr:hypothetical protein BU14_0532s0016 [Porphyra umbilicalis]|eukprot:OSX71457.1 hypothetical protein BU14_0532s0016 [Porphyra umbilicalis]